MFKNVATKIGLFAFDTTTGAPKTGDAANLTAYISKDYGSVTVLADTSATEMDATNAMGWYLFDVAQAETNGNALLFTAKSSTANITVVGQHIFTTPANFTSFVTPTGATVGEVTGAVGSVTARVTANADQLAGQTITAAAGVTFPTSVASPTNITAGTITTVTNLTNAPTAGDLTATMKTSITTAATAATPIAASVAGAVGSVTGNVGGNVTGSVGSVLGGIDTTAGTVKTLDAAITALGTPTVVADAILDRDMATGTDSGGRTVRNALRVLRNKTAASAGTLTVTKEDDTTPAWTAALTTDAGAVPIVTIDPA